MTSEKSAAITPLARQIGDALYYVGVGGSLLTIIAWLVLAFDELKDRGAQTMTASDIASMLLPAAEAAVIPFAIGWALRTCVHALGAFDRNPDHANKLQKGVYFACGLETAFIVFLFFYILQKANPQGDGMEIVLVGFAVMLIFLPFTLPAMLLARINKWPLASAALAAIGATGARHEHAICRLLRAERPASNSRSRRLNQQRLSHPPRPPTHRRHHQRHQGAFREARRPCGSDVELLGALHYWRSTAALRNGVSDRHALQRSNSSPWSRPPARLRTPLPRARRWARRKRPSSNSTATHRARSKSAPRTTILACASSHPRAI